MAERNSSIFSVDSSSYVSVRAPGSFDTSSIFSENLSLSSTDTLAEASHSRSSSAGVHDNSNIYCDACSTIGHQLEANGFCCECKENLCRVCMDCHSRTRASRNHKLLDRPQKLFADQMKTTDVSYACKEHCSVHRRELIEYFCPNHQILGCIYCKQLGHLYCETEYIPEKCARVSDSEEFLNTLNEISELLQQVKISKDMAQAIKDEYEIIFKKGIEKIKQFYRILVEKLDQLKNNMISEANKQKSYLEKNLNEVLEQNSILTRELEEFQSDMQYSKSNNLQAQAFTAMKQVQFKMKCAEIQKLDSDTQQSLLKYTFEPNDDLEKMLHNFNALGEFHLYLQNSKSQKKPQLKLNSELNLRTKYDLYEGECWISGCRVLSSDRLIVTDWNNSKVKVISIKVRAVVAEKTFDQRPFDIAVLSNYQVAMTLPKKREIQFLKIDADKISTLHSIRAEPDCYGITMNQNNLYVVCRNPERVLVLDMQGEVMSSISLQTAQNMTFRKPTYIALSQDLQCLYISDPISNCVANVSLIGEVNAVYRDTELKEPQGLEMLEDGSLLVCSSYNGTIHHIYPGMKQGAKLALDTSKAQSICYTSETRHVYVGSSSRDKIKVFSLQYC